MNADITKLFESGEFSQEFKDKVQVVFEAALEDRAVEIAEQVEQKYVEIAESYAAYVQQELQELQNRYIQEEVVPTIERYLQYSVDEFMKENKLAIESGIKVELAESFLGGLSNIAESYNVKVPAGQEDTIAEMQARLEDLQERFDNVLAERFELQSQLIEQHKNAIVEAKIAELTESQKERFRRVTESVPYKNEEQYASSIQDLYEAYFPVEGSAQAARLNEDIQEEPASEASTGKLSWLDQI